MTPIVTRRAQRAKRLVCTMERCRKPAKWLIDARPYCGIHAGAAAIAALEDEAYYAKVLPKGF